MFGKVSCRVIKSVLSLGWEPIILYVIRIKCCVRKSTVQYVVAVLEGGGVPDEVRSTLLG
jgi:hypothetical protein